MAEAPDLLAITSAFVKFGGPIFRKKVNELELRKKGYLVMKNIKAPVPLTKLSAQGGPRPYRAQDDTAGNGVAFSDQILTVRQSKWDFDFDPEKFRNTYLAIEGDKPYYAEALDQIAKEYLAAINDSTLGAGVYDAAGTTAADLADGFLTLVAQAVIDGDLTETATGVITANNAVEKIELIARAVPAWMREREGFRIKCSYDVFDMYCDNYRANNNYKFEPGADGRYRIDGFAKGFLDADTIMGSSQRLIATVDDNLVVGTDGEQIKIAASMRRNIIEVRAMMPIGCQIQDFDAMVINDQA